MFCVTQFNRRWRYILELRTSCKIKKKSLSFAVDWNKEQKVLLSYCLSFTVWNLRFPTLVCKTKGDVMDFEMCQRTHSHWPSQSPREGKVNQLCDVTMWETRVSKYQLETRVKDLCLFKVGKKKFGGTCLQNLWGII